MRMFTLYLLPGCPYCAKVERMLRARGLLFEEKNILEPHVAEELIARGGKRQVPYFVDHEKNIALYESDDIIRYIETRARAR